MASIMYVGGRAVGVRAYGGLDPVTKKRATYTAPWRRMQLKKILLASSNGSIVWPNSPRRPKRS